VRFEDVRKVYSWRGWAGGHETVKGAFFNPRRLRKRAVRADHVALDRVDFAIAPGEVVAVVGPNGSGKSTLLKLAGGILRPTAGRVSTAGRITALIELGAGFHPEISGHENVVINGMLLGMTRREIEARLDEIAAFADIGDFIDMPVKTYSSGMYVRLGFAVAVAVEPDILLIDEVLAVGDQVFTARCLDRLARMRRRGVTQILVTHDLDLAAAFADRALYLDRGRLVADGPADTVIARYRGSIAEECAEAGEDRPPVRVVEEGVRWGNGDAEIVSVEVRADGRPVQLVATGSAVDVAVRYRVARPLTDFVFGIAWHAEDGTLVGGHNTDLDGLQPTRLEGEGEVVCVYDAVPLAAGRYTIDAAIHARDGLAYDYWCKAATVRVTAPSSWPGVWAASHRWSGPGGLWR
jgi:ABC-type polysaccharide/polyol phosphate transport system ATPase subunit